MNIILYNLSGYKQPPSVMSVVRLLYMQYRSVTEKLKKSSHCICKQIYLLGISLLSFGDTECGNIFKFFK